MSQVVALCVLSREGVAGSRQLTFLEVANANLISIVVHEPLLGLLTEVVTLLQLRLHN